MEIKQHQFATTAILAVAMLLCLLLPGCGQKGEDFEVFLKRFMSDKQFELDRTILPLLSIRHEYILDKSGKDKVDVKVTRIPSKALEKGPTLSEFIAGNDLSLEIVEPGNDPAPRVVKVFKADTDWQFEYHFVTENGHWYLQSIHDYSL